MPCDLYIPIYCLLLFLLSEFVKLQILSSLHILKYVTLDLRRLIKNVEWGIYWGE